MADYVVQLAAVKKADARSANGVMQANFFSVEAPARSADSRPNNVVQLAAVHICFRSSTITACLSLIVDLKAVVSRLARDVVQLAAVLVMRQSAYPHSRLWSLPEELWQPDWPRVSCSYCPAGFAHRLVFVSCEHRQKVPRVEWLAKDVVQLPAAHMFVVGRCETDCNTRILSDCRFQRNCSMDWPNDVVQLTAVLETRRQASRDLEYG